MSTQVQSPFPIFTDVKGDPLNLGYVYIGVANQDPETHPQQAYWDAALTIPALQPIRTDGGYLLNEGNPAAVYVANAYSIRVRAKNGVQVFYRANVVDLLAAFIILLGSVDGAGEIGFQQTGASSVPQTLESKIRLLRIGGEDVGLSPANSATVNSAKLAGMLSEHRVARIRLNVGSKYVSINQPQSLDLTNYPDVGMIIEGDGYSEGDVSLSSGFEVSGVNGNVFDLDGEAGTDAPFKFRDFAIQYGGIGFATAPAEKSAFAGRINSASFEDLLIRYMPGYAFHLTKGDSATGGTYSNRWYGGKYFGNFKGNIRLEGAVNKVIIEGVDAFFGGQSFTTPDQANIFLFCEDNPGYGSVLINNDYSYSGVPKWKYSDGTIVSLEVAGGIATLTTSTAHGRTTGDRISVKTSGVVGLDTADSPTITAAGGPASTSFTFPTNAANGSYTSGTSPFIRIGPQSNGLYALEMRGMTNIGGYCEEPGGYAEFYSQCSGITIPGGFTYNSHVRVEGSENITIIGRVFRGDPGAGCPPAGTVDQPGGAGLITVEQTQRASINVVSCTFEGNAVWRKIGANAGYYMEDGVRYAAAIPTTGAWKVGEPVTLSTTGAEYVCTGVGPLVFKQRGVVGQDVAAHVTGPTGGGTVDSQARTAINSIIANLVAAGVMAP